MRKYMQIKVSVISVILTIAWILVQDGLVEKRMIS